MYLVLTLGKVLRMKNSQKQNYDTCHVLCRATFNHWLIHSNKFYLNKCDWI